MKNKIIDRDRSIIPACDVPLEVYKRILENTGDLDEIGGYKVGLFLGLTYGLPDIVKIAREYTDKPIIYDHQKAGTDIPDMGKNFAEVCKSAGIDAVIIFPEAGPITEYEWIKAAQDKELGVIVGGEMTHPRYLYGDLSESKDKDYTKIFKELGIECDISGFMRRYSPEDIYEIASRMGVTDFVVPGNKPDRIKHYKGFIKNCGIVEPSFYSPGLVEQGGIISEGAKAAGKRFHGIVGRGLYEAKDIKKAALEHTSKL